MALENVQVVNIMLNKPFGVVAGVVVVIMVLEMIISTMGVIRIMSRYSIMFRSICRLCMEVLRCSYRLLWNVMRSRTFFTVTVIVDLQTNTNVKASFSKCRDLSSTYFHRAWFHWYNGRVVSVDSRNVP